MNPIRTVGLAAVAWLFGAALVAPVAGQDGPQFHDVVISFDASNETLSLSLDPVVVQAGRGDRVVFSAPGVESWSVSFAEGSPSPFSNRMIQGNGRQSRNVPILPDVQPGSYQYRVSVIVGGRPHTLDREIRVRPGGRIARR